MFFKLLLVLLFLSYSVKAQEDLLIKEILEDLVDDLPEDFDLFELTERLVYYRKHPINLNHAKPDELKNLFFLSPMQVANFFDYVAIHGKLIDVLEVQAIASFDSVTVRRLLPFIHINEVALKPNITAKNILGFGKNDLVVRYATLLQKQKGFTNLAGSRYLGTSEKMLLRYKYRFANRLSLALVLEKDAGERLISKPTDFSSFNLTISDVSIVRKLIIGDYSLQFGQGLTLWSGFGFGKGSDVTSVAKKDLGLRPYSSANEYSFLRGIASKIAISKKIELTTFWSLRKHDAAISEGVLTTLNETGYHRTQTELKNQDAVSQQTYGFALMYQQQQLNLGIVLYQTNFDKAFVTTDIPYRKFNFTGNQLTNTGIHYSYVFHNSYLFGEFAKSLQSGTALVNGVLISFSNQISGVILYRNYQKNYHNFFSRPTAEAEGFNENGLYAGLNISPSKKWLISAYADYFKFPWLKFRVDAPSQGYESLLQISYTPSKTFRLSVRHKVEQKEQNTSQEVALNFLEEVKKQSSRIDVYWSLNQSIKLQNRLEVVKYNGALLKPVLGYLIYQDFAFAPSNAKLTTNFRIAYFSSPSYDSRIYAYEDDILYNFSFGLYNGIGLRYYLNIKYRLHKSLDIWLRYAQFQYKNETVIGAGLDGINGNKKAEIKFQLRYQF